MIWVRTLVAELMTSVEHVSDVSRGDLKMASVS